MRHLLLSLFVLLAASSAAAQPTNDDFANAPAIDVGTVTGTNIGATLEPGEAVPSCQTNEDASVWWAFNVPSDGTVTIDLSASGFDTVVTLYDDTFPVLPSADDEIACDDDGGFGTRSLLEDVPVVGGRHYVIRVSGFAGNTGDISFDYSFTPAPPPFNDDFENGQGVEVGTITGTNSNATLETGEAAPTCQSAQGASVWWAYTPPSDGTISLDFTATGFDAIATVYLNTFPNLPTQADEIACGDDKDGKPVLTDVPVQGGVTYAIRVAGYDSSFGPEAGAISFDLSFTPSTNGPPNDSIGSPSFPEEPTTTGTNVGATLETDEPTPSCQANQGASVWWVFSVADEFLLMMDFSNSDFDTVVSLYEAPAAGGLTEIACDDDGGDGTTSLIRDLRVQPNTSYYLRVAGYDNGNGPATGMISFESTFASPTSSEDDARAALSLTASPNPTRGDARIRLAVEETEEVTVSVFDATGREVAVLHEGLVSAGAPVELRLGALPAGVYVVRALGETVRLTERVTVVR